MSSPRITNTGWQGQDTQEGAPAVRGQSSGQESTSTGAEGDPNAGGGGKAAPSGGFGDMLPMMAIFAIAVWFLIIRPQKKQEKVRKEMLESLKKGDKVVTTGGLHGTIHEIQENTVIVDLGPVNLTVSRSAVTQVGGDEAPEAKK